MNISVLIPVYQPDKKFHKLLTMLAKQSVRPEKIIILFTETAEHPLPVFRNEVMQYFHENPLLPSYNEGTSSVKIDIKAISSESFDHGATRHLGMLRASSDLVLLMTQDAVPADEWMIKRLVSAFDDPDVAVAYARQMPRHHADIAEAYTRIYNYPSASYVRTKEDIDKYGVKAYFCSNTCAVYRRNTYFELGGFEAPIIFGEDMLYAAKALTSGYKVAYRADARVFHSHSYRLWMHFCRSFDNGVMQTQYPEYFAKISSEQEGIRYAKSVCTYLSGQRRFDALIWFLLSCGFRYAGFLLGKCYRLLPASLAEFFSMNKHYWHRSVENASSKPSEK